MVGGVVEMGEDHGLEGGRWGGWMVWKLAPLDARQGAHVMSCGGLSGCMIMVVVMW